MLAEPSRRAINPSHNLAGATLLTTPSFGGSESLVTQMATISFFDYAAEYRKSIGMVVKLAILFAIFFKARCYHVAVDISFIKALHRGKRGREMENLCFQCALLCKDIGPLSFNIGPRLKARTR